MTVDSTQPVDLQNLEHLPRDFMQHPYGILERLRAQGPVHPLVFPHGAKVWLVTGYDDVRQLLSDPRVSKDGSRMNELFARHSGQPVEEDGHAGVGFNDELSQHMLNSDPPRHTRLRSLVSKEFTLKRMEAFRPRLEKVVDDLLDALDDAGPVVDLVAGFTLPLPIITICDLLGVPPEDQAIFRRWAVELVGAGQPPEVVEAASDHVMDYAKASIASKQVEPGPDMMSALLRGKDEDRLTLDELIGMFFLFTIAGHVTSMHTLTNSIFSLLSHPDELARLRADMSLMHGAVDELMRFDGGVGVATFRFTKEEITLGEVTIPAGEILALSVNSAHRDSSRYPDPDRLDLTRRPTGILGFGHGTHYCIGAPLARIQSEVALTKLLTRYPDIQLAADPDTLEWENNTLLRGLVELPVVLNALARN
ncbi:MAG: cytochrome P450 [Jatrophihabitantaceae bacterium]